jgi:hypothetical protein
MDQAHAHLEHFYHVRIIVGMVLSLSIARLLVGIARFIQHPGRERIFLIHLGWVAWMFLSLIYFWWWEFAFSTVGPWTFAAYAFFIGYAAVFFLLCALLFPDDMKEYGGFADYFISRRKWFFGLLALSFIIDIADTALKGAAHLSALGIEYPLRIAGYVALCIIAAITSHRGFHAAFICAALVYQLSWILRIYPTLG